MKEGKLYKQVALVTGGASGIGEAVALALAGEGARVALLDRDLRGLERVVTKVEGSGGKALALPRDLSETDS